MPVSVEITYGLERIIMLLQVPFVQSVSLLGIMTLFRHYCVKLMCILCRELITSRKFSMLRG